MANARQEDKSTQGMEDAARRASETAAEQTNRIGQAAANQTSRAGQVAAEATEEVARASATLLKQNVETLQNACLAIKFFFCVFLRLPAGQLRLASYRRTPPSCRWPL